MGVLPTLDAYEGPQYRHGRLVAEPDLPVWSYVWAGPSGGMRPLPAGRQ